MNINELKTLNQTLRDLNKILVEECQNFTWETLAENDLTVPAILACRDSYPSLTLGEAKIKVENYIANFKNRKEALTWWRGLPKETKMDLAHKFKPEWIFPMVDCSTSTIVQIWKKETNLSFERK